MRHILTLLMIWIACSARGQCTGIVAPSDTSVCDGQTLEFILSEAGADVDSLQWQEGVPGAWSDIAGATDDTLQVSPDTDIHYRCVLFCASDTIAADSAEVTVVSPITVTIAGQGGPYCGTASDTLVASGADAYAWEPTLSVDPDTGPEVVATPGSTTTYTVTGSTGPCTATATFTVTVNQPPDQPAIDPSGPAQLCAGDDIVLTTTATSPLWSTGETSSSISVSTAGAVWVTDSTAGCPVAASDTVQVNVTGVEVVTCPADLALCSNGAPHVLAGALPEGGTYLLNGTSITTFDPDTLAGEYSIRYRYNSCSDSCEFTITVLNSPNAGSDSSLTTCSNGTAVDLAPLLGVHDPGGTWTDQGGVEFDGVYDPAARPSGTYTYTVSGNAPCSASSASVEVTNNQAPPEPLVWGVGLHTACDGQWMDISLPGAEPALQYQWVCDSCTFESEQDTMATVQWHNASDAEANGTLGVTVLDQTTGCSSSFFANIGISPATASCPKGIVFFEPHGLAVLDPTARWFQWGTLLGNVFDPVEGGTDQTLFDPGLIHACEDHPYVARTSIDGECWSTTIRCADSLSLARICPEPQMATVPELRVDPNPWAGGPLWIAPFRTGSDDPVLVEILDLQGRIRSSAKLPSSGYDLGSTLEGGLSRGPWVLRAWIDGRPQSIKLIVQ